MSTGGGGMRRNRRIQQGNLGPKQYFRAAKEIAQLTWQTTPGTIVLQLAGAIITAVLPIVTTYFAALTTTELGNAFNGDDTAGARAITYVIVTAVLGLLLTGWRSLEQYVQRLMRYALEAKVSDIMYERFLSLEFWRYDDKDTIDVYDRAQRFSQFYAMAFNSLSRMLSQVVTLVASLVALLLVGWWLAVILLLAIIPGVYLQFTLSRAQVRHWNETVDVRRAKGTIERQLFQPEHIAELRLYGVVRHLLNLRQELRDADEKQRIIFERQFILKRLGADAIELAAEVGSLLWITFQIIAREQPIGQFLYVQQIVSRALTAMNSFVTEISTLDEQLANLFDYQTFMELDVRQGGDRELGGPPERIRVDRVSFRYPSSEHDVLKNVSFTIKRGQRIAIVGENGAGKSTLIKIMSGLYAPSSGSVQLDGVDLREFSLDSWHKQLAVLQQDYLSYSFATARDNITFGKVTRPFDEDAFNSAIDKAEAREFLERLPKGVDSYVSPWMAHPDGTNGMDLSGGQWQRLALARNFYRQAPIIILDEPTSAIDALAESRIFNHLFADESQTLIIISHRLTTIERADVILMLKAGRIVERGTADELIAKRGEFYTMFESQI
jgi:ATP-binding cassette, subfamily B, bacterial